MSKKKKITWTLSIVGGIILLLFLANFFVKQRLQKELDARLQASAYNDLNVNIFLNRFSIEDVHIEKDRFALDAEKVKATGLSYYKFLFQNELEIGELELISPKVKIFPKDTASQSVEGKREVLINKISVSNGSFSKQSSDSAAATFFTLIPQAVVHNINTGMEISEIGSYRVELDSMYLKMNAEHYIDVGHLMAEDGHVNISDFKIRSFFSKSEFDQRIEVEKDRVILDVNDISLDSLSFKMRNDSLYLKNPEMTIRQANLNIYRNKAVPDDPSTVPLYSKMLREAPFFINFERVLVENSEIIYEERVRAEDRPAVVRFAALNGKIDNLHNIRELSSQPKITANADFMRGTPVNIDWTFPVFDPQDKFEISGNFGRLEGEALDPFLVPALNARARGTINNVYFNFYGNDDVLRGDYRMEYDEFKVELLKQETGEKKGFLSSLANLLVDNRQEPDEGGGQEVKVERTKNRSFWNYIWKGLREGLLDAVGQL